MLRDNPEGSVVSRLGSVKDKGAKKVREQGLGARDQGSENKNLKPQSGVRTPVESSGVPKPEMNAEAERRRTKTGKRKWARAKAKGEEEGGKWKEE